MVTPKYTTNAVVPLVVFFLTDLSWLSQTKVWTPAIFIWNTISLFLAISLKFQTFIERFGKM